MKTKTSPFLLILRQPAGGPPPAQELQASEDPAELSGEMPQTEAQDLEDSVADQSVAEAPPEDSQIFWMVVLGAICPIALAMCMR